MRNDARLLERALFEYHFGGGEANGVRKELAEFQDEDGGFGRALEPDLRIPESSALATTVAFQTLREVGTPANHPIVQRGIRYFLDTYDSALNAWPIIPRHDYSGTQAPWWAWNEKLAEQWHGFEANPRAEILGYLYDYRSLVPEEFLRALTALQQVHLEAAAQPLDMHDVYCYQRLAATRDLPEDFRNQIIEKLKRTIDQTVGRSPRQWESYRLRPVDVVNGPDSPYLEVLDGALARNLDYAIEQQGEDGAWSPHWAWEGDAWAEARREWQGYLTLRMLLLLRDFGRIEGMEPENKPTV